MSEFERISLEFDIAMENSNSMMDMIYNVLSIEGNNIYLKESSEELDDEELDDEDLGCEELMCASAFLRSAVAEYNLYFSASLV